MDMLEIQNLSKIYGKGESEVKALDNVSFGVPKGQMCAVVGASGSGKSTLLHIIGAVDKPTSGKVFLDGADVFAQNDNNLAIFRRRQVGLIYQFYNLVPVLDIEENITLPSVMDGRKPDKTRLADMINRLGLNGKENRLPSQLSGGQQQRAAIARALYSSPAVVLADEPTGNLDSKNSREIIELLKLSNRELNQTMIVITHDENVALQCDRIITLADGKIIGDEVVR